MIKSMTGYGKGNISENLRNYQVEIKSVNHRYLDINIKLKINGKINEELKQDIMVERKNEGIKEKIPISFLVPSVIQNNQTIVIKGEGNRRKDERGNLNIKVIKN